MCKTCPYDNEKVIIEIVSFKFLCQTDRAFNSLKKSRKKLLAS